MIYQTAGERIGGSWDKSGGRECLYSWTRREASGYYGRTGFVVSNLLWGLIEERPEELLNQMEQLQEDGPDGDGKCCGWRLSELRVARVWENQLEWEIIQIYKSTQNSILRNHTITFACAISPSMHCVDDMGLNVQCRPTQIHMHWTLHPTMQCIHRDQFLAWNFNEK